MERITTDYYPQPERPKQPKKKPREVYYEPQPTRAKSRSSVKKRAASPARPSRSRVDREKKPKKTQGRIGRFASAARVGIRTSWKNMMGVLSNRHLQYDKPLFYIVLVLLVLGLVMMYSASYAYAFYERHNSLYYIQRQVVFAVLGFIAMIGVSTIPPKNLQGNITKIMLGVSYALLVIVLFLPRMQGVRRWINLGFTTFQPSEIAKFAAILTCAGYITTHYKDMNVTGYPNEAVKLKANRSKFAHWRYGMLQNFRTAVWPFLWRLGPMLALIVIEPHLSCTILVVLIIGTQMFVGGTRKTYFAFLGALAAVAGYLVIFTNIVPYGKTRIEVWIDPFKDKLGDGWQNIQSLYAISSGGLFGVGLGNSRQKYLYISEPQNDFIFAVICEEIGLVGAMFIILLFVAFIWRGLTVSLANPDRFSKLVGIGITSQIGFQMILNVCVVTKMVPNTGISLPFFSSGGTSLTMLLAEIGVLLAISRTSPNKII